MGRAAESEQAQGWSGHKHTLSTLVSALSPQRADFCTSQPFTLFKNPHFRIQCIDFRERRKERERERNIDVREEYQSAISYTYTNQGLNLQPTYVP